jgi:hypothetical protein
MRFVFLAVFVPAWALAAAPADPPTTEDEKKVIDAVVKLGGKASIDPKLGPEARVSVKFERPTDVTLLALKKLPQVGGVEVFDASFCTAKGFAALKDLPHLRRLVIERASLAPATLAVLGECDELRHLGLIGCGVTDAGLAGLKKLTLLETLTLSDNPGITDKGMAVVKGFERLQVLSLAKTSITDKGLAELKPLDGLRTLNVRGSRVTPDAAEKFPEDMPNLRKVAW